MLNWRLIIVGLIGIALGAYLNYVVNKISNKKLLQDLIAELEKIKAAQQSGRVSTSESIKQEIVLQTQIDLLSGKVN